MGEKTHVRRGVPRMAYSLEEPFGAAVAGSEEAAISTWPPHLRQVFLSDFSL